MSRITRVLLLALLGLLLAAPALAQLAHHPFAVGASEGALGRPSGLGAWLIGQESHFYLGLTHAVRATKESTAGLIGLAGLSFAYGVFHAAGPGHGKAVITSYMVSNERALRRGLVIALCAAILQGIVATAIVGLAALVFHATAQRMTQASQMVELAGYVGIVGLGLALVWRKGRALLTVLRPSPAPAAFAFAGAGGKGGSAGFEPRLVLRESSRFAADDGHGVPAHAPGCDCGHAHMPDPDMLASPAFDWKAAVLATLTAGARPCSGAILVLVFAAAQSIFLAGVAATFAMSLGTAITTGALAAAAVFAKDLALRLGGSGTSRGLLIGRLIELAAAVCVLLFGLVLLAATLTGAGSGGA